MVKTTVTKTGNSFALRVPMSFMVDNHLKLGDSVEVESPLERSQKALRDIMVAAQKSGGLFKGIKDPVKWQRQIRKSSDPWEEVERERRAAGH